jgi:hypothetical protein
LEGRLGSAQSVDSTRQGGLFLIKQNTAAVAYGFLDGLAKPVQQPWKSHFEPDVGIRNLYIARRDLSARP